MTETKKKRKQAGPTDSMATEILKLKELSIAELAARYEELFGEPSRSRHHDYLWKRVAYKIQEKAYGGLSERAKQRIAELAEAGLPKLRGTKGKGKTGDARSIPHDSRLPPVGQVLTREYEGQTHEVRVGPGGFEYRGKTYKSLSSIAFEITGTHWNGFAFFGLKAKGRSAGKRG